jgi:molybdate transport system ATP-binding protein
MMGKHAESLRFSLRWQRRIAGADSTFSLEVDLELPNGVNMLFGPSGSGKTSLLRCLAGLDAPDSGHITVGSRIWFDQETCLAPHKRSLGYVFQQANLLPHLTALGNLQYAQKRANSKSTSDGINYDELISLLALEPLLTRMPHQLSGGEAQRVAIARALLTRPTVLLMDEPLSALGYEHKQEILPYFEQLFRNLAMPVIYVTHSLDEVARLGHSLTILEAGRAVASGQVDAVLSDLRIAERLGREAFVLVHGQVVARDAQWQLMQVKLARGTLFPDSRSPDTLSLGAISQSALWLQDNQLALNTFVRLRINAIDVSLMLAPPRDTSILNILEGQVLTISSAEHQAHCLVKLQVGLSANADSLIIVSRITRKSSHDLSLMPGSIVFLQIKSVAIAA